MAFEMLIAGVFALLMIAIVGGIALTILAGLGLTGTAALWTGNVTSAFNNIGTNLPLVGTILVFGVIIGLVGIFFGGRALGGAGRR
jgi:hypothetical protein